MDAKLCASFCLTTSCTRWNNFLSVKVKKTVRKRNKMLQRWGMCYVTNKIDSPSTQWHSQCLWTLWFWGCAAWTGNHLSVSECTLVLTLMLYRQWIFNDDESANVHANHEKHKLWIKDDFQSALRTLRVVLTHVTRRKCCTFLHEVNSKFHVNRHYGCEALCFVLSDYIMH